MFDKKELELILINLKKPDFANIVYSEENKEIISGIIEKIEKVLNK